MLTLLAFVFTLAVLIVVHEYGHYIVARWCGVKVLTFSLGFGRPLYTRTGKTGTEFVIAAFPLGGYVKMLDEREAPVAEAELDRAYNRQNVWKRSAIVIAGPLANLLLAIVLYWALFMSGVTDMKPVLGDVAAGSPAAHASIKAGETVTRIGGKKITGWQELHWELLQHALKGDVVEIEARSGSNEIHLHRLDMKLLKMEDFDEDVLEKIGFTPARPAMSARVGEVLPDSVASRAGLQVGDLILAANGVPVTGWEAFVQVVRSSANKPLALELERNGKTARLKLTPSATVEAGHPVGRIGAGYRMSEEELKAFLVEVKYPPIKALQRAVTKTWDTAIISLKMLGSMLTGAVSLKGVSGPVTIANLAGQTAHLGLKAFIGFLALISVSLGVLNLLPVPVLDGGHLMYHIVELIRGAPLSERAMELGQRVGLMMLGLLMAIALYNDINRLITS